MKKSMLELWFCYVKVKNLHHRVNNMLNWNVKSILGNKDSYLMKKGDGEGLKDTTTEKSNHKPYAHKIYMQVLHRSHEVHHFQLHLMVNSCL
ncbi:hypothetical protein Ahy_B05g075161 isoform B [Arachis hypogaea]|uniref:Uncharacterized protein n=1 Tax=Arachis hypogaea TaxID=3818 RepID=A0A444Z109_ARAHY|nr:hypothetical protein Ahy_B05g075161 isoform B [Arachis hypogaea]